MSKKPRNQKDYTNAEERPRKRGPKDNELRKNAPVKQIERPQVTTVEPATYAAPKSVLNSVDLQRKASRGGLHGRITWEQHKGRRMIRMYAAPDGRVKARSKRGWTEPSPAEVARKQAQAAQAEARKAADLAKSQRIATRGRLMELLLMPEGADPEALKLARQRYLEEHGYDDLPQGFVNEASAKWIEQGGEGPLAV